MAGQQIKHPTKVAKNAPTPDESRRLYFTSNDIAGTDRKRSSLKGSAASVNAKLRKNLPIDTIARKDLPKGLLSVTRNNPPIDEEGADVSVATVAAAPNTTAYLAKYGSGH